jgi:hypothetical protein
MALPFALQNNLMFDLTLEKNLMFRLHETAEKAPGQSKDPIACRVCPNAWHAW